ncbi:AraC family transcriptional regulator [Lactobacillus agilis]|uniref:AraC family transcriptional regulator n=1 Tax=Ligilactobacillus agilis TaxID=1601 RepID=UPI0014304022|nr:AraC family transcriptional regulator [Ligilactobacillus agilis]NJE32732.1 AraC family transcriptional regulator [Ligilactobacillus agilis]
MMDHYALAMFKKLENTQISSDYPRLQINTPLALFFKRSVASQILYTSVLDEKVSFFTAPNYANPHQNSAFELVYVLKGSVTKTIEGHQYRLKAGEGYILNRRITHSEELTDGFMLVLNFTEAFFMELLNNLTAFNLKAHPVFDFIATNCSSNNDWQKNYLEFTPTVPLENPQFQILLDSLQQELATPKIGATYLQKGLFLRLLAALENQNMFALNPVVLNQSKEDYLINRLTSYIAKNYGAVSRKEIELELHYNSEYLNRLLKKHTGQTINQYASEIRLQRAKQLLTTTKLPISQITDLLHFSSDNYFYHFFKKATGTSPSRYRQKHYQD